MKEHEFTFKLPEGAIQDLHFLQWFTKEKLKDYCEKHKIKAFKEATAEFNEGFEGAVNITIRFLAI